MIRRRKVRTVLRTFHRDYAEIQRRLRIQLPPLQIKVCRLVSYLADVRVGENREGNSFAIIRIRKPLVQFPYVSLGKSVFYHEVGHIIAMVIYDYWAWDGSHGRQFRKAMRRLVRHGFQDRNEW